MVPSHKMTGTASSLSAQHHRQQSTCSFPWDLLVVVVSFICLSVGRVAPEGTYGSLPVGPTPRTDA